MVSQVLRIALVSLIGYTLLPKAANAEQTPPLQFNREVRSILSDKCFACHGPDANKREAELRLDQEESAKDSAIVRASRTKVSCCDES